MRVNSQQKWKYSTIGLLAVLAVGFSFPQAFAHVTTSLTHNVQDILAAMGTLQSDVDSMQGDIEHISTAVTGLEEKLDSIPGRVIEFNDLELDASNLPYELLPDNDLVGHGIYVDIIMSNEISNISLECRLGDASVYIDDDANGQMTADRVCDGLMFRELTGGCADGECRATINGSIRYTNEYLPR